MKFYRTSSAWGGMTRLLTIFCLVCSWSAEATAPRITSQLFGEEKKADIVGYQLAPLEAGTKSDSELAVKIVTEAFNAAGKTPVVDVLPSKQLATYALFSNEAVALMGNQQDLIAKEKNQYPVVTFYLRGISPSEEPVSLIFNKQNPRGNELNHAFNEGLQKIIKSGKYLEILEGYLGKGHVPTDYVTRLKHHNPGWK
ncbi:MAG: transporter substrate-binding domain-containing protein [Methylobacter sp.]|jgi:hypothetical protein|nr:transporter substrate-binding domain-containing protein [Methylobacter sp.]